MTAAILVCEDDPVHRDLIGASLARGDYRVYEVGDATRLVEAAKHARADLVILDVRLPAGSGIDVLPALRSDAATAATRVLVLTGSVRQADRDAAFRAGADHFLAKPFSPRELAATVEALLAAGPATVERAA